VAIKDGLDMDVKNTKTGKSRSAIHRSAFLREPALKTFLERPINKPKKNRLDPQDIHARLILMIGATLSLTFILVTLGVVYSLMYITQPIGAQAPNDAAFIDLLKTLSIFLTGSLGGVLAGNGLKAKPKPDPQAGPQA
jgi:hypothetical protein